MSDDGEHVSDLLRIKRRRLRTLEAQAARLGLHVPPHVTEEIEDLRRELAELHEGTAQEGEKYTRKPPLRSVLFHLSILLTITLLLDLFIFTRGPVLLASLSGQSAGACLLPEASVVGLGMMLAIPVWMLNRVVHFKMLTGSTQRGGAMPMTVLLGGLVSLTLSVTLGVVCLNPRSPLRSPDQAAPTIRSFSIHYIDGTTKLQDPGVQTEIVAGQQILVEAVLSEQTNAVCAWSSLKGQVGLARGCAIVYGLQFESVDSLTVLVQAPCAPQQQAYAGLSIQARQAAPRP